MTKQTLNPLPFFLFCLQMDKLESIREEDYGQCDSPKAKKVFINMMDSHMHSPLQSKPPKNKSIEGKSINLSSPSSYTSSSPSSTSSLSSTSNVQHQKQAMANQALNGSSEYISKKTSYSWSPIANVFIPNSARYSQHAKFQSSSTNAAGRCGTSKPNAPIDAFKFRWNERWWRRISANVYRVTDRFGLAPVPSNAPAGTG